MALVAAVAASLAGCVPSAEDDEKVITIFGEQGGQMDLNTNSFTLLLEEKFDVDIEFETTGYGSAEATEARQISLAGGDLPEAYMLVPWAFLRTRDGLSSMRPAPDPFAATAAAAARDRTTLSGRGGAGGFGLVAS